VRADEGVRVGGVADHLTQVGVVYNILSWAGTCKAEAGSFVYDVKMFQK
jgi:hypothetical protein